MYIFFENEHCSSKARISKNNFIVKLYKSYYFISPNEYAAVSFLKWSICIFLELNGNFWDSIYLSELALLKAYFHCVKKRIFTPLFIEYNGNILLVLTILMVKTKQTSALSGRPEWPNTRCGYSSGKWLLINENQDTNRIILYIKHLYEKKCQHLIN